MGGPVGHATLWMEYADSVFLLVNVHKAQMHFLVPRTEALPLSAIAWIGDLDDITFQLSLLTDLVSNAMVTLEANKARLDAIEHTQEEARRWALINLAIDLTVAVIPGGPVVKA